MAVAKMRVSMSRHRACCSHPRSFWILLILLSLCFPFETSDVCASSQLPCVRTFRNFDTHPRSTKVSLRLVHRNPCLRDFICLSCHMFCFCRIFHFPSSLFQCRFRDRLNSSCLLGVPTDPVQLGGLLRESPSSPACSTNSQKAETQTNMVNTVCAGHEQVGTDASHLPPEPALALIFGRCLSSRSPAWPGSNRPDAFALREAPTARNYCLGERPWRSRLD